MNLHWPQYVWIAIATVTLFIGSIIDGRPRSGTYRFSTTLVGVAFAAWLLWCGGFFGG